MRYRPPDTFGDDHHLPPAGLIPAGSPRRFFFRTFFPAATSEQSIPSHPQVCRPVFHLSLLALSFRGKTPLMKKMAGTAHPFQSITSFWASFGRFPMRVYPLYCTAFALGCTMLLSAPARGDFPSMYHRPSYPSYPRQVVGPAPVYHGGCKSERSTVNHPPCSSRSPIVIVSPYRSPMYMSPHHHCPPRAWQPGDPTPFLTHTNE